VLVVLLVLVLVVLVILWSSGVEIDATLGFGANTGSDRVLCVDSCRVISLALGGMILREYIMMVMVIEEQTAGRLTSGPLDIMGMNRKG
jgi:hypothetical protein